MKIEQLEKANTIKKRIDFVKDQIKACEYTQLENVFERTTEIHRTGSDVITVPKELYRLIGKLCLADYSQELIKLEEEFKAL